MMREMISLLLALVMLLSSTVGCGEDGLDGRLDEAPTAVQRADILFPDIEFARYDAVDAFYADAQRMKELANQEESFEEIQTLYGRLYGEMLEIQTLWTLAEIRTNIDATSEQALDDYNDTQAIWLELSAAYSEALGSVLQSGYREAFSQLIGSYYAELYSDVDPQLDAQLTELFFRESELCQKYYDLSLEEYDDTQPEQAKQRNATLGAVYLELLQVRKEIASLYGYDSYVDYSYEMVYGRGYSPEEMRKADESVKQYAAPVCGEIQASCLYDWNAPQMQLERVIPTLQQYVPEISSDMADMLDYMLAHEMYFLTDDLEQSMDAGFTVTLDVYGQPFIYNAYYDDEYADFYGVTDMAHEFGHYCDAFLNAPYTLNAPGGDYDMSEVLSCGLELLFYAYYGEIYGDAADEARAMLLDNTLYNLVESCMYDEAQQRIYTQDDLTLDQVNEIFRQTAASYGLIEEDGEWYGWVDANALFERPLYDVSYAAAYSAALEIWLTAQTEGQEAAKQVYLELLSIGSYGDVYYADALGACGMRGICSAEYIEEVSDTVLRTLQALTGPEQ